MTDRKTKKHIVLSTVTTELLYKLKARLIAQSKRRVTDEDVVRTALMAYMEEKT